MPTISWFYGIAIRMYLNDHPPPHFHAYYESSVAVIDIETGAVRVGRLPPRILRFVEQWRTALYSGTERDMGACGTRREWLAGTHSRSG